MFPGWKPVPVRSPHDPRPGHPEVTRGGQQVAQPALGAQLDADLGVLRTGGAAVVGRDPHGQTLGEDAGEGVGDLDRAHCVRTTLS